MESKGINTKERNPKGLRKTHFKDPQTYERLPKTKEDWMKFMIEMIKKKATIEHLSDKDIEGTIKRARGVLCNTKKAKIDPDMPDCYYWKEEQVAEWINGLGFPEVKQMFLLNHISGRRLVEVDASVLNQMGLKDLTRTMQVTKNIRNVLQIPAPNALRAVMRLVPFELYLKAKSKTGYKTDLLNFKKFCNIHGFDYELFEKNKCARIPGTCSVQIKPNCRAIHKDHKVHQEDNCDDNEDSSESTESDNSLEYCPTVEFIVRKKFIRDSIIKDVYDRVIQLVMQEISNVEAQAFADAAAAFEASSKYEIWKQNNPIQVRVKEIFNAAFSELDIERPELSQEQVEFVASVADELVQDILKSRDVINDIERFQSYMQNSIENPAMLRKAQEIAREVLEEVSSIATLLALGQLELDVLIREAPGLQSFVKDIVTTAENEIMIREVDSLTSSQNTTVHQIPPTSKKVTITIDPVMDILKETKLKIVEDSSRKSQFLSPFQDSRKF